jgi:hypothetical protein
VLGFGTGALRTTGTVTMPSITHSNKSIEPHTHRDGGGKMRMVDPVVKQLGKGRVEGGRGERRGK